MKSLRIKLQYVAYTIAEHGSTRVLDAFISLLLIRSLNIESLSAFLVYQSWVAILLLLFPTLENVLYREYGDLKARQSLGFEVGVFKQFNRLKLALAAALLVLCAFMSYLPMPFEKKIWSLALAFVLPLSQSMYGIYRETLRFELKQGHVMVLNFFQKLSFLIAVLAGAHFGGGAIEIIAPALICAAFFFGFIWAWALKRLVPETRTRTVSLSEAIPRFKVALKDVVIWIHINGALTNAIQTLDVYFLSKTQAALSEIALYSVALKAANFFQIIPTPFAQVFGVYLGRKIHDPADKTAAGRLVWKATAGFFGLALVIVALGYFLADPILSFLAKGKFSATELARGKDYFFWQLLGVAVLSICYPVGAYLNNKAYIRTLTMVVFIPWILFAIAAYVWASHNSVLMTAQYNVAVYAFCTLTMSGYYLLWQRKKKKIWRRERDSNPRMV